MTNSITTVVKVALMLMLMLLLPKKNKEKIGCLSYGREKMFCSVCMLNSLANPNQLTSKQCQNYKIWSQSRLYVRWYLFKIQIQMCQFHWVLWVSAPYLGPTFISASILCIINHTLKDLSLNVELLLQKCHLYL